MYVCMYVWCPVLMSVCLSAVCGLNVHKRCERMVPCNCGIKQKDLAAALKEMNISPDKLKPKSAVSPEG